MFTSSYLFVGLIQVIGSPDAEQDPGFGYEEGDALSKKKKNS